jgi:hypothetical protein
MYAKSASLDAFCLAGVSDCALRGDTAEFTNDPDSVEEWENALHLSF